MYKIFYFILFFLKNSTIFAEPASIKPQVIKLRMIGSSYNQIALNKKSKKISLNSHDGKYIFEIEAKPESIRDISLNSLNYYNNDLIILRSFDLFKYNYADGVKFKPLFALDHAEFSKSCYSEVSLLAKKGASLLKKPLAVSSLAFDETVLEVNFISTNKILELVEEPDEDKRVALLLANKVDYITSVTLNYGEDLRFQKQFQRYLESKELVIVQTTKDEIPCFVMALRDDRKAFRPYLERAFLDFENSKMIAIGNFLEIGPFSKLTKIKNWEKIKAKLFNDNKFLKYKKNKLGLKIKKYN